jgi:hypothetical protein
VLRHFLSRKVAPVALPLHASRVEPSASARTLKRRARSANLRCSARVGAGATAVPLTAVTALADQDLPAAVRSRTAKNSIPLVDHRCPARQFLDRRREAGDTTSTSRDHAAPRKLGSLLRAFFLLSGATLYPSSAQLAQIGAQFWLSLALCAGITRFLPAVDTHVGVLPLRGNLRE